MVEPNIRFVTRTRSHDYYLVKEGDRYFVLRVPPEVPDNSKRRVEAHGYRGERVPWAGLPEKVRNWLSRARFGPDGHSEYVIQRPKKEVRLPVEITLR